MWLKVEKFIAALLALSISLGSPVMSFGQTSAAPSASAKTTPVPLPPDPNEPWPRVMTYQGATISIFQPQVESWTGNQITGRSAVRVKSASKIDYGVIWITARTEVDKVNRMVTLLDLKITKQKFPTLPDNGNAYTSALLKDLPWNKTVALDLLEADLGVTDAAAKQKTFELQNNPPVIYFSTKPAVLALIDGKPVLQPTADNFQKVVNTRSLIIYDPKKYSYYLALMDGWMESPTVEGPWTISHRAPTKDLEKIEQGALATKSNQPLGNPQESLKTAEEEGVLPTVYVSTVPAELLVTQGEPVMSAIPGTSLEYVSNTGADIFFDTGNQTYYVLIGGRWFSTPSLENAQWSYVPGASLPTDFAKIPPYSPKSDVLVSVPGTSEAKEAVIANSIPQTATISRTAAKLSVTYYGAPDFQPISGTSPDLRGEHRNPGHLCSGHGVLRGAERGVVHVSASERPVGGGDNGAAGGLYDSAELTDALRDVRLRLRVNTDDGLRGLHARLLRNGGFFERRGSVRNRILLRSLCGSHSVGARAVHLRCGSRLCVDSGRRVGIGVRHGHGRGVMVQSMVGPGGLLRMGLLRCSGVGMGRLRRGCRGQRLRALGQHCLRGNACSLGESLHRQLRDWRTRRLLQSGHGQQRRCGPW